MAAGEKGGGDMVLGNRHLAGIFVALVVLFGVVFTLGYVLGRSHGETQLRASAVAATVADAAPEASSPVAASKNADKEKGKLVPSDGKSADNLAPPAADWDFYHSAEPSDPSARLAPKPKPVSVDKAPASTVPAGPSSRHPAAKPLKTPQPSSARGGLNASLIARGSTVLQVAALVRQGDALALAQALQQKKFPAFVLTPTDDHYYRVQVGPYSNIQAANIARKRLESQGFNSIVKR